MGKAGQCAIKASRSGVRALGSVKGRECVWEGGAEGMSLRRARHCAGQGITQLRALRKEELFAGFVNAPA